MKDILKELKTFNGKDFKRILPYIILALFLVTCCIYSANITYKQYRSKNSSLDEIEQTNRLLTAKIDSIRRIDKSVLEKVNLTIVAIPDENPKIYLLFNTKQYSNTSGLMLKDIKFLESGSFAGDIKIAALYYSFLSPGKEVLNKFLEDINKALPVIKIKEILINSSDSGLSGSINAYSFWDVLPDTIPPITTPVKNLTDEQLGLLDSLSDYNYPSQLVTEPAGPYQREDPFN